VRCSLQVKQKKEDPSEGSDRSRKKRRSSRNWGRPQSVEVREGSVVCVGGGGGVKQGPRGTLGLGARILPDGKVAHRECGSESAERSCRQA